MRPAASGKLTGTTLLALLIFSSVAHASTSSRKHKPKPVEDQAAATKSSSMVETSFDNVEFLGPDLDGKLSVTRVGSDRTNTNLLSIFATLKNLTSSSLMIEAETLYKDANGDWLEGGKASWLPLEIKPHEEMEYRSASLSDGAQDFLVRIRRPVSADDSKN